MAQENALHKNEETLNGKLHFFCSDGKKNVQNDETIISTI